MFILFDVIKYSLLYEDDLTVNVKFKMKWGTLIHLNQRLLLLTSSSRLSKFCSTFAVTSSSVLNFLPVRIYLSFVSNPVANRALWRRIVAQWLLDIRRDFSVVFILLKDGWFFYFFLSISITKLSNKFGLKHIFLERKINSTYKEYLQNVIIELIFTLRDFPEHYTTFFKLVYMNTIR